MTTVNSTRVPRKKRSPQNPNMVQGKTGRIPKKTWDALTAAQQQKIIASRSLRTGQGKRTRSSPQSPGDKLMLLAGAHGRNPLAASNSVVSAESYAAPNQDSSHDVEPIITKSALIYAALGIVLAAKKRGWNTQNTPNNQFQAFGYIITVFQAALRGETLEFTVAPRWFCELCAAIAPKTHPCLTGSVVYEPVESTGSGVVFSSVMTLGTAEEAYTIAFGEATGTPINGFNPVVPAPAYDPVVGKDQFSSLWNVFYAKPGTPSELISPLKETAFLSRDCSAFAMNTSSLATSFFAPGGANSYLQNEVVIDSPILSKFCDSNSVDDGVIAPFRRGFKHADTGGTACYIGPRCLEFKHVGQFRNKSRAVFKFYDFDEFVEVGALIIGGILERATKQTTIAVGPYPLSSQQFQTILRQCLIPFFKNEMAQDLRMKEADGPVVDALNKMIPFTVSDNGVSQTALATPMSMPRFYVEAVKGCRRLAWKVGKDPERQMMDAIPVLARDPRWQQLGNYTYAGENLVFQPLGALMPMNIIDCSVIDGSNTFYLNLNGTELSTMINLHNDWMSTAQPFITGLAKLDSGKGSKLFSSLLTTRIVKAVSTPEPPQQPVVVSTTTTNSKGTLVKQNSLTRPKGVSMAATRCRAVNPIPGQSDEFANFGAILLQSNVPFLDNLQKYQMCVIAPKVSARSAGDFSANPGFLKSLYGELLSVSYSSSVVDGTLNSTSQLPTLYSLHQQMADIDLKNIANSARTEIEVLLDDLDAQSGGGFLTGLAKVLSMGAKVAGGVGELTGW